MAFSILEEAKAYAVKGSKNRRKHKNDIRQAKLIIQKLYED